MFSDEGAGLLSTVLPTEPRKHSRPISLLTTQKNQIDNVTLSIYYKESTTIKLDILYLYINQEVPWNSQQIQVYAVTVFCTRDVVKSLKCSIFGGRHFSLGWTPSSLVNHRSYWTPRSWTDNTPSVSGVYLRAFTTTRPVTLQLQSYLYI